MAAFWENFCFFEISKKSKLMESEALAVGWNTLPVEISGMILDFVTNRSSKAGVPLHFVCKQWHTLLPPPSPKDLRSFVLPLVEQGSLSLLQWAKQNGCSFPSYKCCPLAARGGHLEVLKWLRQNGSFWDETCWFQADVVATWMCWRG